jgi:hypothetical protein
MDSTSPRPPCPLNPNLEPYPALATGTAGWRGTEPTENRREARHSRTPTVTHPGGSVVSTGILPTTRPSTSCCALNGHRRANNRSIPKKNTDHTTRSSPEPVWQTELVQERPLDNTVRPGKLAIMCVIFPIRLGHTNQETTSKYVNMARGNVKSQHSKYSPGERLGR